MSTNTHLPVHRFTTQGQWVKWQRSTDGATVERRRPFPSLPAAWQARRADHRTDPPATAPARVSGASPEGLRLLQRLRQVSRAQVRADYRARRASKHDAEQDAESNTTARSTCLCPCHEPGGGASHPNEPCLCRRIRRAVLRGQQP